MYHVLIKQFFDFRWSGLIVCRKTGLFKAPGAMVSCTYNMGRCLFDVHQYHEVTVVEGGITAMKGGEDGTRKRNERK